MSRIITFLIILVCLVEWIQCEGYYTIVGSKIIRPNSKYKISINSHGYRGPATIKVEVTGTNGGVPYSEYETVIVDHLSTKTVTLNIKNVTLANCKLVAQGTSGIIFNNQTNLVFTNKSISIFALTDKAVYKPGDKVRIRILVLDYKLLPFKHKNELNILITDGEKNQIKKYTNVATVNGVFSTELDLSSAPVLGQWTINVTILNAEYVKYFDVDEYILPQFEVTLNVKRHASFDNPKLSATLISKYTFGKPVKGKVYVKAWTAKSVGDLEPKDLDRIFTMNKDTDGKILLEFDLARDLYIGQGDRGDLDIIIQAVVEETLTGYKQNTTSVVTFHSSLYQISFISDSSGYKHGLPYIAWVQVNNHDGTPVREQTHPVIVRYTFKDGGDVDDELVLDDNGRAKFELNPNPEMAPIDIEARYRGAFNEHGIPRKFSKNNKYIQVKVRGPKPTVGKPITLDIKCLDKISYFTYIIIGRGSIIDSETISVPNRRYHLFRIMATFEMIPKAKLLVYYIHSDGQIIFDAIDIRFPSKFQNNVQIDLSTNRVLPADNISISINARPNSFVGILGVDQSVLLLKQGNDLNMEDIFRDLLLYQGKPTFDSDSFYEFENVGAVVITNVNSGADSENDADVHISTSAAPVSNIAIRKNFPETWLWETIDNIGPGELTLEKTVPDTITSWVLTGFAIDAEYGFGMTQIPKKLEVFKDFFISTNLPYSIKQGETVKIPIVVFNYYNQEITADISLDNSLLEFDFMEIQNEIPGEPLNDNRNKQIQILPKSGKSEYFMIKPKVNGEITIKISAISKLSSDVIEKKLLVIPEGVTKFVDLTTFVDVRDGKPFNKSIDIVVPDNAVRKSTRIQLTVFGDLFGPTVSNLNHLIVLPTGCGEQNMLKFAPNIVVLNYLTLTNQSTEAFRTTAIQYLNSGYQNQLKYKRSDGSFSVWGSGDGSGSSWLTAYVTRFMVKATKFINVDENIIKNGLNWLKNNQHSSGNFPEIGRVIHKEMQGESANGLALTAFTLLAFLESEQYKAPYANVIHKSKNYIAQNINDVDDVYVLAIVAYALQLGEHSDRQKVLLKLKSKAINDTINNQMYWSKSTTNVHLKGKNCVNIEITAYALMTFLAADLSTEAIPIVNWLAAQTNNQGGFSSTQDTVVALQALAKFPAPIKNSDYAVQIKAKHNNEEKADFIVNKMNAMVLQSIDLPSSANTITITGSGKGVAVARVSYQYNVGGTSSGSRFDLEAIVSPNTTRNKLHMNVCASYIAKEKDIESGMTVIEVGFPSGFTVNDDISFASLKVYKVQKFEKRDADTVAVLYFDKFKSTRICVPLAAVRTVQVADLKPSPVTIYDYYDNTRNARIFYNIPGSVLCDICEGQNCPQNCN